jgi:hypothetical protein
MHGTAKGLIYYAKFAGSVPEPLPALFPFKRDSHYTRRSIRCGEFSGRPGNMTAYINFALTAIAKVFTHDESPGG